MKVVQPFVRNGRSALECLLIVYKARVFCWTTPQQPAIEWYMWLNISSLVTLGRGPEKTVVSKIIFAYAYTDSIVIDVTSDWRRRVSSPPMWIRILPNVWLCTIIAKGGRWISELDRKKERPLLRLMRLQRMSLQKIEVMNHCRFTKKWS